MPATPADSLRLETEVRSHVRSGEPVRITLRAINTGAAPFELSLTGRTPVFDIIVSREDGEVVWRRLEGEAIPMILQLMTLAPGEALVMHHDWDQQSARREPIAPGTYFVHGAFLTDAQPLRTPAASVRILPRPR